MAGCKDVGKIAAGSGVGESRGIGEGGYGEAKHEVDMRRGSGDGSTILALTESFVTVPKPKTMAEVAWACSPCS